MPYRFKRSDASVAEGGRRIAFEQIDKAVGEIDDAAIGLNETVHQVRKRCKKLRGLLRIVRPVFSDYKAENRCFRDAARSLSSLRDAEALLETYDDLVEAYEDQIDRPAFASIRRRLTLRQKQKTADRDIESRLANFRAIMLASRRRVEDWSVEEKGFDALEGGIAKTWERACAAMEDAASEKTPEAFHEWRKRVKYHLYHARLVKDAWKKPMKAQRDAADGLSDLLGDHHDLAVLRETLQGAPKDFGNRKDIEAFLGLIDRRRAYLEAEALQLGGKLLCEPSESLTRRWRAWWEIWRESPSPEKVALAA